MDDEDLRSQVQDLIRSNNVIEAVKLVREERGYGLKEAKDMVDGIRDAMIADGENVTRASGCVLWVLMVLPPLSYLLYTW